MTESRPDMPTSTPMPGDPEHGPIVRHGRNPIAIVLLVMCLISGVGGALNPGSVPPTLAASLGPGAAAWNIAMAVGSALCLVGVLMFRPKRWRTGPLVERPLYDVLIERIGMVLLSTVFAVYCVFLLVYMRQGADVPMIYFLIILGMAVASSWRAAQITVDLRRLRKVLPLVS